MSGRKGSWRPGSVACDVSRKWTSIARRFWHEAGVADRIDLRLGPASQTLAAMIAAGEGSRFDFACIDPDKPAYPGYYTQCLELVRPGGLIAIDNAFLDGSAVDPRADDSAGLVVNSLTQDIFADERVDAALVPVSDGLVLARKR